MVERNMCRPGHTPTLQGLRYPGGVVLFEWFPPPPPGNYCITHYSLHVTGGDFVAENLPASATSLEVRHLPVCTGLNVSLTAFGSAGRSSPPTFFRLQPQEAGEAQTVVLTSLSFHSSMCMLTYRHGCYSTTKPRNVREL
ncbi:hypothetical protein PR048_019690 [Dryococelus australis]|uniref:Fibronectin type-III domain-containing protein n=1 Tax=Dryococelus australis TaxID=614101 RepID=A0ABQ9H494_9NEOP|nr:hypothetical protein PR048_019690 [Dryococelus australis]